MQQHVMFSEGLMLLPHHFQLTERFNEEQRLCEREFYSGEQMGLIQLRINQSKLKQHCFSIEILRAIMPDGACIDFDHERDGDLSIICETTNTSRSIYLAVSTNRTISSRKEQTGRYERKTLRRYDQNNGDNPKDIEVLTLKPFLYLSDEAPALSVSIELARVASVNDYGITLDSAYWPPILRIKACLSLCHWADEIVSLANSHQHHLVARLRSLTRSTVVGVRDWLMLQMTNRLICQLSLLLSSSCAQPYDLFACVKVFVSEMATYTYKAHSMTATIQYDSFNLAGSFKLLMKEFVGVIKPLAHAASMKIELTQDKPGLFSGYIENPVAENCRWVLIIQAPNLNVETLQFLQGHLKVSPKGISPNIASLQISGLPLTQLMVAPRELPEYPQAVYFELDCQHALFKQIIKEGALCVQLASQNKTFEIELWVLSQGEPW